MTQRPTFRFLFVRALCCALLVLPAWIDASADNLCDAAGDVPDVIVGDLYELARNGTVGNITAYSVGTYSCNPGTCWLDWCDSGGTTCAPTFNSRRHPVIMSSMYRLKDGRMEQLGQSWLKHGFAALSNHICGGPACSGVPDQNHLGINCSDPYNAGLNGQQSNLGPKDEVNSATGIFLFPFRTQGQSGNAIYKRLQVRNNDLQPSQNAGAKYWVEGMYLFPDDAPVPDSDDDLTPGNGVDDFDQVDNSYNNSSYRRINVTESAPNTYNISAAAATVRQLPAIAAWVAEDPTVLLDEATVADDGRYWVASKATDLGGGQWHYEYAVLNHTSDRSAGAFSVPLPFGVNLSNIGFHDVDYHSENTDGTGSFYDPTDWSHNGGAQQQLRWSTVAMDVNVRANALRWSTMYNFRFDADAPPATGLAQATIELWKPGNPESVTAKIFGPSLCDSDSLCEIGETAVNCTADCVNQGGGGGQCGDGTCNVGEGSCSCLRDCGSPPDVEFTCNDGKDNDCDGRSDCVDSDCCSAASCAGADTDGDGYQVCDCNSANPAVWFAPGEVEEVLLTHDIGIGTTIDWQAPVETGAVSVSYEVIRSQNPANLLTSTTCVPDGVPTDTTVIDTSAPSAGTTYFYEVRAVNACPQGDGPLGRNSDNIPRQGRSCP